MTTTTKPENLYISGVLIGLHRQKAGQYLSLKIVTSLTALLLLVVVVLSFVPGDGSQKVSLQKGRTALLLFGQQAIVRSSPGPLSVGHIGKVRIVAGAAQVYFPPFLGLPEFGFISYPAPGVFESPHHVDGAPAPLSTDSDFGLPEPPPLWRFAERGLPAGIVHDDITLSQPPHAVLVSPVWPDRVWLADDTAVVEGLLTFHAHGLLSFELVSESHPGLGFGAAVQQAIYQATCFPSVDKSGRRATVRCRYRCLFFEGGRPSVSVGASVTAIIKRD